MAIQIRQFLLAVIIFLCLITSFSAAEERPISINFWPVFQYISDSMEGTQEIEGLGPFFCWKKNPHQSQWGIRPLLYWTGEEKESLWRLEYIYPFGKYQVREGDKKGYLAPISLFREETFDGKKKWDFQFFPFFIGETEKGEDYFGLFPIYGFLFDRYGKDEIRFYLWPLYGKSISEGVHTTNLIWPFFSFIRGERKRGERFWPFYGRKEEFGVSKSEFLLWPIFSKQTRGMDTDDPVHEWMVFPFYVSKESKHFESKTLLWPFFSHAQDRLSGFEQWDILWPFFQSLKGENLYGIKIFPLYGYKEKRGELKRMFILYPLYQLEEDRVGDVLEKTHRILLLTRIRTGEGQPNVKKESFFRIWPFFIYEMEETGRTTFSFPYLFPFKEEGFERNFFPLFRLFHWEKDPQGRKSTDLFWGLYKRIEKEELDFWEIAHLVGVKKGKGKKTISLFKGLFHYKEDGKASDLRLFYLPFHLRWSHQQSIGFKSNEEELADE